MTFSPTRVVVSRLCQQWSAVVGTSVEAWGAAAPFPRQAALPAFFVRLFWTSVQTVAGELLDRIIGEMSWHRPLTMDYLLHLCDGDQAI